MTEHQARAILGEPLSVRDGGGGSVLCDYALQGSADSGPALWIDFDEDGGVTIVQATLHHTIRENALLYYAVSGRNTSWVKIQNREYSRAIGRSELSDAKRPNETRGASRRPELRLV